MKYIKIFVILIILLIGCTENKSEEKMQYNKLTREEEQAVFAGGCFWGVEYLFQKLNGVISTTVGYTGGSVENPTYEQVCTNTTGHAEALMIIYDPKIISYRELAQYFFEIHDFTQVDRQGPDVGKQYRSAIFYTNETQKEIATDLINQLSEKGYKVATILEKFDKFWPAEEYHQDYYKKNGNIPYCHFYQKKF